MASKSTSKPAKAGRFDTVENYLKAQDPVKATTLKSVIDFILAEFPELESKISWNVPQILRRGKYVFGVAAFKNHLSLAPWSPQVMKDFKPRLVGLVATPNTFQIPIDWKMDKRLIRDLVKARLAELG